MGVGFISPFIIRFFKLPKNIFVIGPIFLITLSYAYLIYKYQNFDSMFIEIRQLSDPFYEN
jgi:hypothetical protein